MRVVILAAVMVAAATPALAAGSNNVRGHIRSDGTYVAPHYRTNPDSTTSNNWSTKPNVNPYTGQSGTREPSYTPRPYTSTYTPYSPPKTKSGF